MTDTAVQYVEQWHCEQPGTYRVIRDWWDLSQTPPVRHVYEVRAVKLGEVP